MFRTLEVIQLGSKVRLNRLKVLDFGECKRQAQESKFGISKNFQMFKLDLDFRQTRDQIANIYWITENAREFQKNIYFCSLTMPKPLCGPQQTVGNP